MHFARPEALFLCLTLIPILFFLLFSYRGDRRILRALKQERHKALSTYFIFGALWIIIIVSLSGFLARPQTTIYAPPLVLPRGDIVLLVDVSLSMEARSSIHTPTKMETSRSIMLEVVAGIPDARFLVFGYSALAFSLSSFSNDYDYLEDVIMNGLYTEVIPQKGSRLANALSAVALEKQENPAYENVSYVVLFSDGEGGDINRPSSDRVVYDKALARLQEEDISVISVGIGSKGGDQIPIFDEEGRFTGRYVKIFGGTNFRSVLQESTLRQLSLATSGQYFSQYQSLGLIRYIRSTLSQEEINVNLVKKVQAVRDMSWIFLIPLTIGASVLFLKRRDFY